MSRFAKAVPNVLSNGLRSLTTTAGSLPVSRTALEEEEDVWVVHDVAVDASCELWTEAEDESVVTLPKLV